MRRFLAAAGMAVIAGAAGFASASGVSVNSDRLGAGSALASSCDADGVRTAFTTGFDATVGYTVTAVQVTGIDATACHGRFVGVSLTGSGDNIVGSGGPVQITAASMNVPVAGKVPASSIGRIYAVIS